MNARHLLVIVAAFVYTYCQTIILCDYKQEDSKSECRDGLISGVDVVVFKCLVDYSQDRSIKHVTFQTKKTSENIFILLTDCNVQEDCKSSQNTHGRHIDTFVIEITITVNATPSYSLAKLRGLLYRTDNKVIASSEKIFPKISDISDASVELTVNGKTIPTSTECREYINRTDLSIQFLCESKVNPCWIEISTDDSNEIVQRKGNVTFYKDTFNHREINVLIKYAVCRLTDTCPMVNCTFIKESTSKESRNNIITDQLAIPLTIIGMIIMCFLIPVYKYKKKVFRICLNGNLAAHGPLNNPVTSTHTSDSDSVTSSLLIDTSTLDGAIKRESYIDVDRGTHPKTDSTRRRHITTFESCIVLGPCNLMEDCPNCPKKESHKSFIQVNKFSKEHLPEIYHKTGLEALLTTMAYLTVKVTITHISHQRPEFYPETDHQYPFSDKKGDNVIIRNGTGFIKRVKIIKEAGVKCTCHKCRHSEKAAEVWGKIYISTTKSLVFDDSEARKSTFKICFNEETGPYHCLDGLSVKQSDINDDQGEVECVTCDTNLIKSLRASLKICSQKMANVNYIYKTNKFDDNLTIIVSHPHGCPKHVSMGKWTNRVVVGTDGPMQKTKYTYTTPTCQGSIGAFVYLVGVSDFSQTHHLHCGVNDEMHNFCSTGWEPIIEKI